MKKRKMLIGSGLMAFLWCPLSSFPNQDREVVHFRADAGRIDIHGRSFKASQDSHEGASHVEDSVWVDVMKGQLGIAVTDFDLAGHGQDELPTYFRRYYDPTRGWSFSHDIHMTMAHLGDGTYQAGTVFFIQDEDGMEYSYYMPWSWENAYNPASFPAVANSKEAMFHKLTLESSYYVWKRFDGRKYYFGNVYQISGNAFKYPVHKINDRNDNSMVFKYDSYHRLKSVSGAAQISFSYQESGSSHLVTVSAGGRKWDYLYSDSDWNRLLTMTDPANGDTTFTYNNSSGLRIASMTDPTGNKTSFTWKITPEDEWRVTTITDPLGHATTLVYPNVTETKVVDPRGVTTYYIHLDPDLKWTASSGGFSHEIDSTQHFVYDKRTYLSDGSTHSEQFEYDDYENIDLFKDAYGNQYRWTKNKYGQITKFTDPLGYVTTYSYDSGKYYQIKSKKDALGRVWTYTLDSDGNRTQEKDPDGNTTQFRYVRGDITYKMDRNGNVWDYDYDGFGSLVQETDPYGNKTKYSRDSFGQILSSTDALGRVTSFKYDQLNRIYLLTHPDGSQRRFYYDKNSNKTREDDENGYKYEYYYDNLNRLVTAYNPKWKTKKFTYDAVGNQTSVTDENNHTTSYSYDELNRVKSITDPAGNKTRHEYEWNSGIELLDGTPFKPTWTRDPRGIVTEFLHDNMSRLRYKVYHDGTSEEIDYDAVGNISLQANRAAIFTDFYYDNLDRLVEKVEPENRISRYEYDPEGNMIQWTDPKGYAATYQFDELNRITQVTDPKGSSVQYGYDEVGNRTGITNQLGKKTSYQFDTRNRLVKVTDPLGYKTSMSYDDNGNLIEKTHPKGYTLQYQYDSLNQLVHEIYPDGTTVSFTYDNAGNRKSMTDSTGTTLYQYDEVNRLKSETYPNGLANQYQYDGNTNRVKLIDYEGHYTAYAYDNDNRLTQIFYSADGSTTNFDYDVIGRRTYSQYPNGVREEFWYDWADRLNAKKITNSSGGILRWISYEYDANDNRSEMNDIGLDGVTYYQYDASNQLTQVNYPDGKWAKYQYDSAGNRTKESTKSKSTTYVYNSGNRLTSQKDSIGASINYSYDANGNLTQKKEYQSGALTKTTAFTWDYDNLMKSYSATGSSSHSGSNTHDGDGRQITSVRDGASAKFHYDGLNILYDLTSSNQKKARYITELGLDEMIGRIEGGAVEYYHSDGLGSVVALTKSDGSLKTKYRYDAWGLERVIDGSSANTYTYTSRKKEKDLGLLNYRARYYDPTIGRFISQDPFTGGPDDARIGYENDIDTKMYGEITLYTTFRNPHSFNRYAYVRNNPLKYTDPLGLFTTGTHDDILDRAFSKGKKTFLPVRQRNILKKASLDADRDQSPQGSFKHSMRDSHQTPREAEALAKAFVDKKIKNFQALKKLGYNDLALYELGFGIHTVTDASSPQHEGFQKWRGLYGPVKTPAAALHGVRESFASQASKNRAILSAKKLYIRAIDE